MTIWEREGPRDKDKPAPSLIYNNIVESEIVVLPLDMYTPAPPQFE